MGAGCPYRAHSQEELVHLVPDEEEVDVHKGWTQIARLHRRLAFRRRLWSSLGVWLKHVKSRGQPSLGTTSQ